MVDTLLWAILVLKVLIFESLYLRLIGGIFPGGSDGNESSCNAGDLGFIPGLGRVPGRGLCNPPQYPCLRIHMGRGACQPTFHGLQRARRDWVFKQSPTVINHHSKSVQFSCSVMYDSLKPHGLQHTRLPCPSLTPGVYSNSCPSNQCCHPTTSSSAIPFSSCLPSFPASGSFPMSQFFASGGPSIGVSASASALPINIQDWFSLGHIARWRSRRTCAHLLLQELPN